MTAYEKWTAQLLLNTPVLYYPDFSLSSEIFWLDTDASQRLGIGLFIVFFPKFNQMEQIGWLHVVAVLWMSVKVQSAFFKHMDLRLFQCRKVRCGSPGESFVVGRKRLLRRPGNMWTTQKRDNNGTSKQVGGILAKDGIDMNQNFVSRGGSYRA